MDRTVPVGKANSSVLLILHPATNASRGLRILAGDKLNEGTYVTHLSWLLFGKLKGAKVLDSSLLLSDIEKVEVLGLPTPRQAHFSFGSYLLLLTLGTLFLSTPLLVRYHLNNARQLSLEEAREYIAQIGRESNMDSNLKEKFLKHIRYARSVDHMSNAVMQVRE